jgi:hypothetical protein
MRSASASKAPPIFTTGFFFTVLVNIVHSVNIAKFKSNQAGARSSEGPSGPGIEVDVRRNEA